MSPDLNLYAHPTFGNLRTIIDGGTIYICAKDAATALGYANTNDAIKRHCKGVVKRYPPLKPPEARRNLRSSMRATSTG